MAAEKRQSVSGKIATPKPAVQPQELSSQAAMLSKAIGARVRITTSIADYSLEGTIFTACPISNVVALNTAHPSSSTAPTQPGDYHIVPVAHIASFTILSLPTASDRVQDSGPGFGGALPSISKVNLDALRAREETAVRKLKDKEATRNKNASREGQELFDQLSRTLPTRWHDLSIVVNDAVMIQPPYGIADAKANKDGERSLQQVKKIMEAHLSKRAGGSQATVAVTAAGKGTAVATPIPPRKGG